MLWVFFWTALTAINFASVRSLNKIPDFIKICKMSQPKFEECIIDSVNQLKPNLRDGISDMGVPAMEPMILPEVVISKSPSFKAIASDLKVHGSSDFQIKDLKTKVNLPDMHFEIQLIIPAMLFEGQYEVAGQIMIMPLNGKGPISANATNVEGKALLKGLVVNKNGAEYIEFRGLDLKLNIPNYSVRMENLFGGDKVLGDAINLALNENKKQVMRILGPLFERVTSSILLDTANKITEKFTFEQLFGGK